MTVKVRNTGRVAGKEVVQLYIHEQRAKVVRPEKELKAFAKIALEPGEEKMSASNWGSAILPTTMFPFKTGSSIAASSMFWSVDLRRCGLKQTIEMTATEPLISRLTRNSLLKEFAIIPKVKPFTAS